MRPERFEKERKVVLDVLSCEQDTSLTDAQMLAKTIDVSEAGMKVSLYVGVPEKARVALRLDGELQQFKLEGEVRWVRDDGEPWVGVLLDPECADYALWREAFANL